MPSSSHAKRASTIRFVHEEGSSAMNARLVRLAWDCKRESCVCEKRDSHLYTLRRGRTSHASSMLVHLRIRNGFKHFPMRPSVVFTRFIRLHQCLCIDQHIWHKGRVEKFSESRCTFRRPQGDTSGYLYPPCPWNSSAFATMGAAESRINLIVRA
jgi:hypothetical protein